MAECTCADPMAVKMAIDNQTKDMNSQSAENTRRIDETVSGKADGGDTGAIGPIRLCHYNAPEYGRKGEFDWAMAFRLAALGIAIANGIAQSEIADKQQDLADGWYAQAKYKWDRFHDKYMPLEKKLLNEVSSVPIRNIDCDGAQDRAQASTDTAYASTNVYLTQQAKKLRLCLDPSLLSAVNQKQSLMSIDSTNFNLTDERWFTDFKNDQRWNRRSNVLNLGRNLSSQAMEYGKVANALYGQVGRQIETAAGGLMQAFGYYGARNDTYYSSVYLNTHSLTESAGAVALNGATAQGGTGGIAGA